MYPSKLLGESSEVKVGVFIERIGWALNDILIRATFNLVSASSVISMNANPVKMPQKLFSLSTDAFSCSSVKLVLTMK